MFGVSTVRSLYIFKGKKATFTITIPLKLCETLKGAFQCQAAVEAPNFSKKKITMIRGWFKLRDTLFSSGSKKCRLQNLKSKSVLYKVTS